MQTGGRTLGIPAGVDVHPILPKYAKTDFKHDFTGAQITTNVLNDIETVGSRAEFFAKIQPFVGKDAYEAFQQFFSATLPPLPGRPMVTPVDDMPEERLLDSILTPPYAVIAGGVGQSVYDYANPVTVKEGGVTRNYGVIRVAEKLKAGAGAAYASQLAAPIPVPGQYVNLVSCLWAASSTRAGQRVKTFVIMYDAAVVALSEIGDMSKPSITEILVPNAQGQLFGEPFDKTAVYEVYFVNSIENVRDPAPKLTEKSFRPDKVAPNVHLYFLTDPDHQARYEMHARAPATQASNLYSRYTLTMTRVGSSDRVRAVIEFEDGTTVQLDDLKRESEIDASVVNAISILLRKGLSPATVSEVMSCFFLKRSGDWCQALCLLDKERVYQISGTGPKAGGTTTLAALETEGAEVMLMTHDRVLLAYALLLGLNVCFTNNRSSGHWIIYFKNLDVFRVDDYATILESASALLSELTAARATATTMRTQLTDQVGKIPWLPFTNLIQIRGRLNILANLPSDEELGAVITSLQTLRTDLTSAKYEPIRAAVLASNSIAAVPDAQKPLAQAFSDALGRLRTALPNIRSMLDGVMKYTNPAFQYPQQVDELETVGSHLPFVLNGQRSMKESHKDASGKTFNLEASLSVLASRLMDDLAQASVRVNDLTLADYPAEATLSTTLAAAYSLSRVTRTHLSIARGVFDLVKKAQVKQGRGQRGGMKGGGGIEDLYYLPNTIYLLTEISVRSMPPGTPDTDDVYYFVQGDRMINYDRWQYTVVDDYIVTKELEPALVGALATFLKGRYGTLTAAESPVILRYLHVFFLRLLILWADILYNESLVLFDEPLHIDDTGEENDLFTEVTRPDEVLFFRLSRRLAFLQQILAPTVLSAIQTSDPAQYARSIELTLQYSNGSFQLPREMRLRTSDEFQTQVGNLVGGLRQLYAASSASKFLATIRQAELQLAVVPDGDPFIAFFDPLNGTVTPAPLSPTAILVGPQLTIPEGVDGRRFFQNIATNVYVPLVPQPTPEETAAAIDALRGGSRLHPRRALYGNARTRTSSSARRGLYAGLRERTWPRTTARVRQRSGRAKTGRQRKHLDRL